MKGVCRTSEECSERRGISDGSCADGFAVCCVEDNPQVECEPLGPGEVKGVCNANQECQEDEGDFGSCNLPSGRNGICCM